MLFAKRELRPRSRHCEARTRISLMAALTMVLGTGLFAISNSAIAAEHTGTVAMLELWPNGNVAFTLNGATLPCNGQLIVNGGSDGAKNMYAALLSAKMAGRQIRVVTTTCGPAAGYNPSVLYTLVDYLYVVD
jgi:hypothetical protein